MLQDFNAALQKGIFTGALDCRLTTFEKLDLRTYLMVVKFHSKLVFKTYLDGCCLLQVLPMEYTSIAQYVK